MDGFWKNNGDKVLVGAVTAVVVLLLSEPIKALFKKVGNWIEKGIQFAVIHRMAAPIWLEIFGNGPPLFTRNIRIEQMMGVRI